MGHEWQPMTELEKAMAYDRKLQRQGLLKDFKRYFQMLDEYANIRGFWDWDHMINTLQRKY